MGSSGRWATISLRPSSTTLLNFSYKKSVIPISFSIVNSSFASWLGAPIPFSSAFTSSLSFPDQAALCPVLEVVLLCWAFSSLFLLFDCFLLFIVVIILSVYMLNQSELNEVYKMVDSVPFSRTKKNISRDFSDALMMAQLIYHYSPKLVQLHNYPPANSLNKKIENWNTLNLKVLKKVGINLSKQEIQAVANGSPGLIQQILHQIYMKFEKPEQQGSLSRNGRLMEGKQLRKAVGGDWQEDEETNSNNNNVSPQRRRVPQNTETEQVLTLVAKIDAANEKLFQLKEHSKLKDQIIQNLEKKIERLIFN